MPVESAQYIHELNASYPNANDARLEGDDHLRMIKATLKNTFPNVTGTITRSHAQLNKAPYDRATIESLLSAGEKLITSKAFTGASGADIVLGYNATTKRIVAQIGNSVILPAFATVEDAMTANGPAFIDGAINFGNKFVLRRYMIRELFPGGGAGAAAEKYIAFTPGFTERPFWAYGRAMQGNEFNYAGTWSYGGDLAIKEISAGGMTVQYWNNSASAQMTTGYVWVLGKEL